MSDELKKLLKPSEVAKKLQIPASTLYKLCSEGKIPAAKIGKHWRFDEARLARWLSESYDRAISESSEDSDQATEKEQSKSD